MRVAVVGAGVVGLAVSHRLLELGHEVTCFEQGEVMGERSVGSSRIFRLAHREAELVALAAESLAIFRDWEQRVGVTLIEPSGTVISGAIEPWAEAMRAAGASFQVGEPADGLFRLPTTRLPSTALLDPAGGVLLAERIRDALVSWLGSAIRHERVVALELDPTGGVQVTPSSAAERHDALVICAGSGTPSLAAQLGLGVPAELEHHARFSFRLRPQVQRPLHCWLATSDRSAFGTYQHLTPDGLWAVGGHADPADPTWSVTREASVTRQRAAVRAYVASELDLLDPDPIETLYCTPTRDLDDGFRILRAGTQSRVLAIYGDNLFKMAPVIARRTAEALTDDHAPLTFGATYA